MCFAVFVDSKSAITESRHANSVVIYPNVSSFSCFVSAENDGTDRSNIY